MCGKITLVQVMRGCLNIQALIRLPDLTQGFQRAMARCFLIVLNELFLAGWLIVKGFNPTTIDASAEQIDMTGTKAPDPYPQPPA